MTLRIAVVGAGPAGIYAADSLLKSDVDVAVDLLDRLPAPYGLVRYGVAPDHPRIKEIVKALDRVLASPGVRFLGGVDLGVDVKLEELRELYDAVVVATGARADRDLGIPGEELTHGAADFVSWYDSHPDAPESWPLDAASVAVVGVGNVALDVARVLAKDGEEMRVTDVPGPVLDALRAKTTTDVHVFSRRGPAYVKFSPLELRELNHSPSVEVVVHPEGFDVDDHGMAHVGANKSAKLVLDVLANWVGRDLEGKPHRIHLHFCEAPVEVVGEDGRVTAIRTERTAPVGDGTYAGTGEVTTWEVGAVYRAIGYRSSPVLGLPFDDRAAVVPNVGGRVVDLDGEPVPGAYVTGWVKRGPVGLIGHTKSDAAETVGHLLADLAGRGSDGSDGAATRSEAEVDAYLAARGVDVQTYERWRRLDDHEVALGAAEGRTRVKVAGREEMLRLGAGLPEA
ncbi:FAD-dependent oxidoreductase [Nocardioides perillae]|uniref:ferredoxin--NADP(+) reductase n=1 Tax=Nocardioides perillae TaxID=1119534 RepID=A0A7Y9RSW2_9ACTN|nr:FAD-dependent oxidoreductase [Nocardioides perillae]NYG53942.1 ferredoxin--NADP+ reductase [Nocardioides perillae]